MGVAGDETREGGARFQWPRDQVGSSFILKWMESNWRDVKVGWHHWIYFRKSLQLESGLEEMKGYSLGVRDEDGMVSGAGSGDALVIRTLRQWGGGVGEVPTCFQTAWNRNNQAAEVQVGCHFIPHWPLLFLFRPLLKAIDIDWHGCERRGPRGSALPFSPVRTVNGKGLEARDGSELSMDCMLCIKMQLKTVFPWNEQSAKTKIRSRLSHPVVCSRTLGWGHL